MDTSRAVINIIDNSETFVQETTEVTGFTVVKAPKGPITPIRIRKGGASELKDIFGVSSKEYPDLFEAETFNKEYDLYVSAPYTSAKVPVAFLTGEGIVLGSSTIPYREDIEAYALGEKDEISTNLLTGQFRLMDMRYPKKCGIDGKVPIEELIPRLAELEEFGDNEGLLINTGIQVKSAYASGSANNDILGRIPSNFVVTLSDGTQHTYARTSNNSNHHVEVIEASTSQVVGYFVTVTPSEEEGQDDIITIIDTSVDYSNTTDIIYIFLLDSENILNIEDAEVRENLRIYWKAALNSNDVYAAIFPKFPSSRELHISFSNFSAIKNYASTSYRSWNNLKMRVYEDGAYRDASSPVYVEGSLDTSDRASDGSFLGFSGLNSSYMGQNLVCVYPYKKFTETSEFNSNIEGFGEITLRGGEKKFDDNGADLYDKGWQAARDGEYADVDIFFDSEIHATGSTHTTPNTTFLSLATDNVSAHELAGYIFNQTLSPTEITDAQGTEVTNLGSKRLAHGYNYWNICNIGIVEDRTNGTRFSVSMTGAKALMQARIIEYKMGGVAPMWENTSVSGVSLGGQLNMINIYKLQHRYTKKQLDLLDDLNYNPVINDRQYGIMVVGQKTCKDGASTDWSYIGHTSAFLNFLKQVRANVMIPQIGKPNNPYYRTLRKDQVDLYLAKRINGSDRIWAEAECDTSTADGVNDVHALKARKFVIKVRVKVDVFSEKVELNFTNEGQDTIISTAQ